MIKIIIVAIIFASIILFLKNIKSDLAILVEIVSAIMLIMLSINYILDTFNFFNQLINLSGLDKKVFNVVLKIIAVSYVIEFGAGTIEDFGLKGLSNKVILLGKFVILGLSFPVIFSIFNMFYSLLT